MSSAEETPQPSMVGADGAPSMEGDDAQPPASGEQGGKRTKMPSRRKLEAAEVAKVLAKELGETEPAPLLQLARIVFRLGAEVARALVQQTEEIESAGGMLVPDGSRRRTRGGVYFALARGLLAKDKEARALRRREEHARERVEHQRRICAAVEELLHDEALPLRAQEIAERIPGSWPKGVDLPSLIGEALSKDIAARGEASPFVRATGGGYALRGSPAASRRAAPKQPAAPPGGAHPSSLAGSEEAPKTQPPPAVTRSGATGTSNLKAQRVKTAPASAGPKTPAGVRVPKATAPVRRVISTAGRSEVTVEVRRPRSTS